MAEKKPVEPTFESAMERLEEIVGEMESDKLPLEEMLERFEEGTRLVKWCSGRLAAAEKRIEIIARNAAGKPEVAEFDPGAETPNPAASPAPARSPKTPPAPKPSAPEEDIRLF